MAANAAFPQTPRIVAVRMNLANTARDGSGTLYTLDVGRANGTLCAWMRFQALAATLPGVLRVFINGQLFQEIATQGGNPTGTAAGEYHDLVFAFPQQVLLGNGESLQASTQNAETWNVIAFMGDL